MPQYAVGKEVVSYCGSCKLNLSHLIMALKPNGEIAKCQCKTCSAVHGFRSSSGTTKKKRAPSTRKRAPVVPLIETWKEGMAKVEDLQKYSIRTNYKVGDGINHPKFGEGFVEAVLDSSKVSVVFQMDIKTLVHGK